MPSLIWLMVIGLYAIHVAGLFVVSVAQSRKPALALTWLGICLVLPFAGLLLYALSLRKVPRRQQLPWESKGTPPNGHYRPPYGESTSEGAAAVARGIAAFASAPASVQIQLYHSGAEFYGDLIFALQSAVSSIDMEFYIFRYDEIGRTIVEVLLHKAAKGVRVRFLYDGLGSRQFPSTVLSEMRRQGIDCRVFFPLRFPYITRGLNHRDHSKIVLIDNHIGFTGGMNVGKEYAGWDSHYGPWRDTHCRIVGRERLLLCDLFEVNFAFAGRFKHPRTSASYTEAKPPAENGNQETLKEKKDLKSLVRKSRRVFTDGTVQFLESGPDSQSEHLRQLFFQCLTQSKSQVEITTPYFLPESDITMALYTAVARGVRVRLLLPEKVDHRLIGYACQTYFPELLHAGVEIYLYRPGVLHAKLMTVDDDLAILGAANYDLRSFRLNYELCMVQYGADLVRQLRMQFERDLESARKLDAASLHRSLLARTRHSAARLLAPLL